MADVAVDKILEIMKNRQAGQLTQQQQAIEQERNAQLAEQARNQLEESHRVNTATIAHNAAQLQLQQKSADLNKLLTMQQIGQNIQQGAPVPAGSQVTPQDTGTGGGVGPGTFKIGSQPTVTSPAGGGQSSTSLYNDVTLPTGEKLAGLPTQETYASKQANVQRILNQPGAEVEANKIRLETERQAQIAQITQDAMTTRQLLTEGQQQTAAANLEKIRQAGENARNQVTQGTLMSIAKMNSPMYMFNSIDPEAKKAMTQPSIQAMYDGNMSVDQVQKEFAAKGLTGGGLFTTGQFMANGGVPPSEKQVEFKKSMDPVIQSLGLIRKYISMLPDAESTLGGSAKAHILGLTTNSAIVNPDLDALYKQIEFNIATVAKNVGGDAGQRLQQALLAPAAGGFMPNKYIPKPANVSTYNRFVGVINNLFDSNFANMPAGQKANIKNNAGLTNQPLLAPNGKPISGGTSTIHFKDSSSGKEWDIPAEQANAFKAAHPTATGQ